MPTTSTQAIAYLRVSSERQREKGAGLEAQRQRVEEYATRHGLELVDVVQEAASGMVKTGDVFSWERRPVLLSLIERAKRGEYQVLVVSTFDRLSRDHPSLVMVQRILQQHGVETRSSGEDNGDGPDAELLRTIKAGLAQYEATLIRGRMEAGRAVKRQQGRNVEGRAPFGYVSKGGILEPVEEQAVVVRRIFERAKEGQSPSRIARDLNTDAVPSARGAKWSRQTVGQILRNATYAGERGGIRTVAGLPAHTPIVSRRLWNSAQAALTTRRRDP